MGGLVFQILLHLVAEEGEVFEAGVELVEDEDGGGSAAVWSVVRGVLRGDVGFGCFKGEDALGSLVFGDGEIVFGKAGGDDMPLFIDYGDVEKDEGGGGLEGGGILLSACRWDVEKKQEEQESGVASRPR